MTLNISNTNMISIFYNKNVYGIMLHIDCHYRHTLNFAVNVDMGEPAKVKTAKNFVIYPTSP